MRTLRSASKKELVSVRVATINLRAYPKPAGLAVTTPPEVLRSEAFGRTLDARSESRPRFGRALSMDRIEQALVSAFRGGMRDLTDILSETVDTDPHLGSVLNKRFGALASLPFEVQPASGYGIDREKAAFYAEVVRQQIRNMKSFRTNLRQLAWGLFHGRACLELNWIMLQVEAGPLHPKYGSPNMAVQEMDWIHPRRLSFGPQRELRILPENASSGGNFSSDGIAARDIPDKFIYWLPQLFNEYPEREGLGPRTMYWSFFKRFAARERMILTELYGKPWRIVEVEQDSTASKEDLKEADAIVDALGATHTARMPRGTKLHVESPGKSAGEVHNDIIDGADKQISKLVLGQTGTTDGVPAGLNSNQANVMQDEQLGVMITDATMLSDVVETYLCDRIIAVNFGEAEVTHAPSFRLRADLPADRTAELGRLQGALNAGLSISQSEAYEVSGFSIPESDAVVIRMEQPPTAPNSPVAPAVRPVVVFPVGKTPEVGEQQPITPAAGIGEGAPGLGTAVGAADAASTITVNEDRAARGLEPLALPDGQPDPRGDLTIAEFNAKIEPKPAPAAPAPALAPKPTVVEPEPELQVAARKRAPRGLRLAEHISDDLEEGEDLHGDGGIHGHLLERAQLLTRIDGPHQHVWKFPDGSFAVSQLDGQHQHAIATVDADDTNADGEHVHNIIVSRASLVCDSAGSSHRHALQVLATAVDGSHQHLLSMPDPNEPGGVLQLRSLSAGQIAAEMAAGTMPEDLFDDDFEPPDEVVTAPVTPDVRRTRFERVLQDMQDPIATYELTQGAEQSRREMDEWASWVQQHAVHLAKQVSTSNGTPDDLLSRGMRELVTETNTWATKFEDAVAGQTSALGIYRALAMTRSTLPVGKFGRSLERRKVHAMMLGAIDNAKELGVLETAPGAPLPNAATVKAAMTHNPDLITLGINWVALASSSEFSKKPFKQALTHFQALKVMDRPTYERATAAIKQRSFTVAGQLGNQMLQVLQSDLVKAIEEGEDLHAFKARIKPRLEQAGFIGKLKSGQDALGPAHVETVFRTNVLNTYNTGRYVQASQPAVLAAFPVWQIQGVRDDRTRHPHLDAHGKKLLANDPFWNTAYPPFGFSCRCRVNALPKSHLKDVVSGSTIVGLPDAGFTSGKPSLAVG